MLSIIKYILLLTLTFVFGCESSYQKRPEMEAAHQKPSAISLFGEPLYAPTPNDQILTKAREYKALYAQQSNVENLIWHGRFEAYKANYNEAIKIYTRGIQEYPEDDRLFRHRGHRYITIRQFDKAIADLEEASNLIAGKNNEMEPDGMPNAQNIPVSSRHGNIWYHLGLAYYLNGDMPNALESYKNCLMATNNDDNVVSATHWLYMINRRLNDMEAANSYLKPITKEMAVIENMSYHNICKFYKGLITEEELLLLEGEESANDAILYALINWDYYNDHIDIAKLKMQKLLAKKSWNSFGYIAAEADYARLLAEEKK